MLATPDLNGSDPRAYALSNTPPHRVADRKSFPFGMPHCRIYQPSALVMQPGGRPKREWLLEFEPAAPHWIEPLMGWTASDDPFATVRLPFATRSAAIDYAERHGLDYEVIDPLPRRAGRPLTIRAEGDRAGASLCALLAASRNRNPTVNGGKPWTSNPSFPGGTTPNRKCRQRAGKCLLRRLPLRNGLYVY